MIFSPGVGLGSNRPHFVETTPGLVGSEANAGLSVYMLSPFKSVPVVMLNGAPEFAMMNGLKRIAYLVVKELPNTKRCRMSNWAREYSAARSYWLAGNVPRPSVLLFA